MPRVVVFASLTEEWSGELSTFTCGDDDLDSFLVEDALRLEQENVTRTALAVDEEVGTLLGYVTALNDAVRLMTKERRRLGLATDDHPVVPALKIARLGVLTSAVGSGVGRELVRDAYLSARESASVGGCRLLTVDAYPDAVPFYEKLGFQANRSPEYRDRENPSMRLDVFAPDPPSWL